MSEDFDIGVVSAYVHEVLHLTLLHADLKLLLLGSIEAAFVSE